MPGAEDERLVAPQSDEVQGAVAGGDDLAAALGAYEEAALTTGRIPQPTPLGVYLDAVRGAQPVAAGCALGGGTAWACARWSRRAGWGDRHRPALAGGALLTYVWLGFVHTQEMGVPPLLALTGNVLFGAGAVLLLGAVVRRLSVRRPGEPPPPRDACGVSPREIGRRTTAGPGDTRTDGHRIRTALDERRTHGARIGERPQ